MGSLKPGATYVYERVDDVVYARQAGSPDRYEIGRDYTLREQAIENQLWYDIRRAAETNKTLQSALDHAIMIYKLSKDYNNGI